MFVGKQSKAANEIAKILNVNISDVKLIPHTGSDVSILTEANNDMLGLKLQNPDGQQTVLVVQILVLQVYLMCILASVYILLMLMYMYWEGHKLIC